METNLYKMNERTIDCLLDKMDDSSMWFDSRGEAIDKRNERLVWLLRNGWWLVSADAGILTDGRGKTKVLSIHRYE